MIPFGISPLYLSFILHYRITLSCSFTYGSILAYIFADFAAIRSVKVYHSSDMQFASMARNEISNLGI